MKHKLTILMLGVLTLGGCAARGQQVAPKATEQAQIVAGRIVVPCSTDSDCEQKNPKLTGTITEHAGHFDATIIMDGKQVRLSEFESRKAAQTYINEYTEEGFKPKALKAEVFYCEAITKSGKRCSRHVPEPGLLCKQHSKMVKEGKPVKTID